MGNSRDRREDIDGILREAYESAAPQDSWQALRERIEMTLSRPPGHSHCGQGQAAFWRHTALAMAACLIVAIGLLFYGVSTDRQAKSLNTPPFAGAPALLTQAHVEQLVRTFAQVRSLFAEHRPWLLIDSAGNSQMGLTAHDDSAYPKGRLIILRLLVQENGDPARHRYADLVAYPQQQIMLEMPTAAGGIIKLRLVPTLREDGRVNIDFVVRGDDGSHTGRITPVGQNAFTPLAQIQMGRHGFRLEAIATVQWSEQG